MKNKFFLTLALLFAVMSWYWILDIRFTEKDLELFTLPAYKTNVEVKKYTTEVATEESNIGSISLYTAKKEN